jgi:1-acyl-sn-glycerol-3-phosphate acyltransferase
VALKGNWDAFPRGAWFPRFKKVTAIFGEPFVVPKDASKQQGAEFTQTMMERIAVMLGVPPPEKAAAENNAPAS